MGVRFAKMNGCGNDFIVIDNRDDVLPCAPDQFAVRHCERRKNVGADGLMLLENSDAADFCMVFYNSDGSRAEMCGNAARCLAMFAFRYGIVGPRMTFETLAGPVRGEVDGDLVTIGMANVDLPEPVRAVAVGPHRYEVHFIEAGVPHTILYCDEAEAVDVDGLGRELRYHEAFAPRGTNVDFVQLTGPGSIRLRTYERGVEAETMACGTGAIAAAVVSHLRRDVGGPPVSVRVNGGELNVSFRVSDGSVEDVRLTGDAVTVCEGEICTE